MVRSNGHFDVQDMEVEVGNCVITQTPICWSSFDPWILDCLVPEQPASWGVISQRIPMPDQRPLSHTHTRSITHSWPSPIGAVLSEMACDAKKYQITRSKSFGKHGILSKRGGPTVARPKKLDRKARPKKRSARRRLEPKNNKK
jgi:hypothetical protein